MQELLLETGARVDSMQPRQYLTFALGEETYAVSIRKVREIVEFRALTEIPLMPGFLRGVTNLRGAVIPVVDLLERFELGRTSIGSRSCIVVVEVESAEESLLLGVLVNAVNAVLPVEAQDIEARPSFGTRIRADFIESLLNVGGHFVPALEIGQVMSVEEMALLATDWNVREFASGGKRGD